MATFTKLPAKLQRAVLGRELQLPDGQPPAGR